MANYNDVRAALEGAIWACSPDLSLNTYSYVPRSLTPPALILQPHPHRAIDYMQVEGRGLFAAWRFNVMIVVGQIDEEAAQQMAGDLISPGSPMITAIQGLRVGGTGFTQVLEGGIAQMMFDQGLYTYAELSVVVKA
jgi:hypothetical protein